MKHRSKRPRLALAVLALSPLTAGCQGGSETGIRVIAHFGPSLVIDQLKLTVTAPTADPPADPLSAVVPDQPGAPLASGTRVLLQVDEWLQDFGVTVQLEGWQNGQPRAAGQESTALKAGTFVDLPVELTLLCTSSSCQDGDSQCVGDSVRSCRLGSDGCARWDAPKACPPDTPYCSNGLCAASCEDECPEAGQQRCATGGEAGRQTCGQHDEDSCLDWGPVLGCGAKELCQDGECLPDCNGQPCSCQPGTKTACADVGECRGGERACTDLGTYGACSWTVGPTAELCDGKDNDCSGTPDDHLIAPPCSKQLGVCAQSTATCGGTAGWKDCDAAAYQSQAQARGLLYQAAETECDGQDNDCNGKIDEPASCCQPDCNGKKCGLDPVCGVSCGSCSAKEKCDGQGQCVPTCTGEGPQVVASAGDVGTEVSMQLDAAGKAHLAFTDESAGSVRYGTNASGAWQGFTLGAGRTPSLGLDSAGKVHISYADVGAAGGLKYFGGGSGAWVSGWIVEAAEGGGVYPSIQAYGTSQIHICYLAWAGGHLACAQAPLPVVGPTIAWTVQTVDAAQDVGFYSSLKIDGAGKLHVSYFDSANKDLKYATNASGSWKLTTIDSQGEVGWTSSLAVDGAGKVHISYYDAIPNVNLKYATNASGSWQTSVVDDQGNVGLYSSLGIDGSGKVHISYYHGAPGFDLKYVNNASGSWQSRTVDSQGDVGSFTSLAVDSSGRAHIAYHDATNKDLKYVVVCP